MESSLLRNMIISAVMLAAFGGLGTGLVITTFELTKEQIEASEKSILLRNLNTILQPGSYNNDLLKTPLTVSPSSQLGSKNPVTVYQAKMDNKPVAVAFAISALDGYNGEIKMLIAIKASGAVAGVRVISHKETPGLGDKIEVAKTDWINEFNNKTLTNPAEKLWKVKKDGGVFDQFTGATITPRAIVKAVHRALDYYQINRDRLFLSQEKYDQLYGQTL